MKRIAYTALSALLLTASLASTAQAYPNANTATCPIDGTHCVGSGGGAGN